MTDLADAIRTARAHIPIQKEIVRPEYWSPYVIVRTDCGRLAVYKDLAVYEESAWSPPVEIPALSWGPPKGTRVGTVSLNGLWEAE